MTCQWIFCLVIFAQKSFAVIFLYNFAPLFSLGNSAGVRGCEDAMHLYTVVQDFAVEIC